MEAEKEEIKEQIQLSYAQEIRDREEAMLGRLAFEKDELMVEKNELEVSLQQERYSKKVNEADKKREDDLARECEKLSRIIEQKELEQKMLKSELSETRTENVKQRDEMLVARENLLHNFADLMETELQCSICNELFVQVSLVIYVS